jgi:hypothetical protein
MTRAVHKSKHRATSLRAPAHDFDLVGWFASCRYFGDAEQTLLGGGRGWWQRRGEHPAGCRRGRVRLLRLGRMRDLVAELVEVDVLPVLVDRAVRDEHFVGAYDLNLAAIQ